MNHDALFKTTFSDPEQAAALLRSILAADLVAAIDWSTLTLLPTGFVDGQLHQRFVDLLFSARCHGVGILIYVLFEHRSHDDATSCACNRNCGSCSSICSSI